MKYGKDILKVGGLIAIVFFAVMGYHFSDAADTRFWWNFWYILAIACLGFWIVGWVFFWNKTPKK